MKRDWVNPDDIIVIQSPTVEDFLSRKDDIALIQGGQSTPGFWDWAPKYFPFFWLFYLTGDDENIPVGLIRRDFFTRSVEIHGCCREGYQAKGIEYYATLACLNDTFLRHKFTKVTIPVPDGDVATRAFARRWGFVKTDYREGDVTYWRLKRDQYMERINAKQTTEPPEGLESPSVQACGTPESESCDIQ
jgi:hypothetical protein